MSSASEQHPTRHRLRIELWSWSAWLVLAIISYPAVLLIWVTPRAGLLAGLLAGLAVVYTATLGYSGRRGLDRWLLPTIVSLAAATLVGLVAAVADRGSASLVSLAVLVLAAELTFIWHFLPWLAHDAEQVDVPHALSLHSRASGTLSRSPVRPALTLVLLLGLLVLGVGAAWSRGEARVPPPTAWIVVIAVLTLALMFVERLAFFERSSREGNLLMVAGAYRWWLTGALATLLLLGSLAAVLPWRQAKERPATGPTGADVSPFSSSSSRSALQDLLDSASSAAAGAAAAVGALPRGALPLLLLLLLLLLVLILMWGFRRSRAAQWLLRAAARVLAAIALLSRRLAAWFRSLLPSRRQQESRPTPEEPATDPLSNPFEDPGVLAGLSSRQLVVHAYHLLLNFAEIVGHGRRQNQTPFEYAAVLAQAVPDASESVRALTWAYSGAMYGGDQAAVPDLGSVRDSWERVTSALARGLSAEDLTLRHRAWLAARLLDHRT